MKKEDEEKMKKAQNHLKFISREKLRNEDEEKVKKAQNHQKSVSREKLRNEEDGYGNEKKKIRELKRKVSELHKHWKRPLFSKLMIGKLNPLRFKILPHVTIAL